MGERSTYVDVLQKRLQELRDAVVREKLEVRRLLDVIGEKEAQMGHIVRLLVAEGVQVDGAGPDGAPVMSVADMAYEVLAGRPQQTPIHYRDLADLITAKGRIIPGRDPGANLIAHVSRDERFMRTGRGMYALAEWGLTPAKTRTRRRPRRTEKGKGGRKQR